ncbi:MAG TPA: Gfo/Idh/MocA family oxidoreductase [Vicinamibacterales bacterium]|nr:Gfo/Idh/MocA family oxidoreductase [Vicinamibacterales bacterium]
MFLGIIGGGNISDTHARAAASIPGVTIAAIYGSNPQKTKRLAERVGGAVYDDLDRFLAHRPMDLVAIGSPSALHAEQGIAAVTRGLHVLAEKPLDITTARVDALIDAADRAGVKLGVFFQDRLKPAVVRMKELIDAGRLGTPVLASGHVKWYRPLEYYGDSKWRGTWALDGGGALMNQGIHTVDVLLHLFGPVARVSARTATRLHSIEVEDTAAAVLEFESGALGIIEAATSVFPGYSRRVEVTGSEGTLVLDQDRLVRADLRTPLDGLTEATAGTTESATSPVVSDVTPHRRILEDFIRAIQTNGSPACDGREGRRSVAIVEAIYASARTGQTTDV